MVFRGLSVKWLLVFCAGFGAVYLVFWAAGQRRTLANVPSSQVSKPDHATLETQPPPRIQPLVRRLFAPSSAEAAMVSRVFQEHPRLPINVSYCCHLLRLYGLKPFRHPLFSSGSEVARALTDQALTKEFFGKPILFRTRSGVRYQDSVTQKDLAAENHRDICLATFAELGLQLSTPVTTEDASFTLADLLRDSVENFDIKQQELAWTGVAYAIYLRQRQWSNRYGESFTFDDLANELMRTPFENVSCGGAHLLYALTVLLRAKGASEYVSESVRCELSQYLRRQTTVATQTQANDGSWDLNWHVVSKAESSDALFPASKAQLTKLLVTGHLLEWLELLPEEIQPPSDVYVQAARWICTSLASASVSSMRDYCPVVHALLAARALIDDVGD